MLGRFKIVNFNVDQVFGEFIGGNSTLEDGQTITLFPDIQPKYSWVAWLPPTGWWQSAQRAESGLTVLWHGILHNSRVTVTDFPRLLRTANSTWDRFHLPAAVETLIQEHLRTGTGSNPAPTPCRQRRG